MVDEVLRLDGVCVAFDRGRDRVSVMEDISMVVGAGEIVAVVGGAGQGKTTLLRLASGTLPADRGTVHISGVDVTALTDRRLARVLASDIGLATGAGPGARVTVREYVEMALSAPKERRHWLWRRRWRRQERRHLTSAILEELGIVECAELSWDALSDWQRVLAELAQAVVVRPRLLLLDDIGDRFGLGQKQELMDLLEGFARRRGCGVLMVVSDDACALRAVRVWRLRRRKVQLMADHTADDEAAAEVIPLRRSS
jgi:ABC-type cobalamin/Fe3+-siderophores transport system ATPase subunit